MSFLLQPIYDVKGWSRNDTVEPPRALSGPPRAPAGATCDFPFFDPLEAEFEKVVFTKVVALAMLYLINFENLKKVDF